MCGIIGAVGQPAIAVIVDGLKRLEYRGYDSAGVAVLTDKGLQRHRVVGRIEQLRASVPHNMVDVPCGIGHTRWATHGVPSEANSHPQGDAHVMVAHNGIIENHQELRKLAQKVGYQFTSDTDTEVIAALLSQAVQKGASPHQAMATVIPKLRGSFALAILFANTPDTLYFARYGSPLALAKSGDGGAAFLASDPMALYGYAHEVIYLADGEYGELNKDHVHIFDAHHQRVTRSWSRLDLQPTLIGKDGYRHFMLKEIFEQPMTVASTVNAYTNAHEQTIGLPYLPIDIKRIQQLHIIACGSSYYAGMVGRYALEELAVLPCQVDVASEFRYKKLIPSAHTLYILISQSGETADTLAVLHMLKAAKLPHLSIVNVPESTMVRDSMAHLLTKAGPEIGVASTKAFTAQLAVLTMMALTWAHERGTISVERWKELCQQLIHLPAILQQTLKLESELQAWAQQIESSTSAMYMGRHHFFPIALEGALKLKEISYIHAEGFAGGELKHGPLALIDQSMPVVVVAPLDALLPKALSNMQEVLARKAQVFWLTDAAAIRQHPEQKVAGMIAMPTTDALFMPIVATVPLQLLAYHVAVRKGRDVDQPRNLAKSVTVE